jgi:hypothetical protein
LNGSLLFLSFFLFTTESCVTLSSLVVFILLQNLTASLVLPLSLSRAIEAMEDEETEIIGFASVVRSLFTYLSTIACAFLIEESSRFLYTVFLITSFFSFLPAFFLINSKKTQKNITN